ncbi:MAG: helix-turn-helix domain-containing protein [Bradyrhizobium sp.]|uniref:helix-turn-helix domain-containing protein n=1 Tax=Bradyrhizobium sp. TaxID=376 RepID=UPI003919AACB
MAMRRSWRAGAQDANPAGAWAEGLANAFVRLDFEGPRGAPFAGVIDQADLGDLKLSRVRASAHGVWRRAEHARSARADLVFVNLQVAGVGVTAQGGRERRTAPFDLAVADTLAPFAIAHREPFELICAGLPRALAPAELMARGGVALSRTPAAREIARLLLGCAGLALNPVSTPTAAAAAARCFLDLLASAADSLDEAPVRGLTAAHVRDYIGQNFREATLRAARAARAFGVSERHIQKLLAGGGASFGETLAGLRLEAAAQALAAGGGSVAQIAYECGFSDLSTFHRAFKARFGETPAAYRAARVRLPPLAVRSTP